MDNNNVDKAHVGLSNVLNEEQVTVDLGNAPSTILNANTTKTDVGLSNVQNLDQRDGGNLNADSVDIAVKGSSGSIGTINGVVSATATLYEYSELYRPAWNTTGRRHIADTTQTTGSDSGETGSIPAITAGTSILGNSPIMTFTFTTHNWGSGTRTVSYTHLRAHET